ncbi:MAG: hypothetical protein SFZ02_21330 [bacterium]|nr:hypothetical protein [bacterium]
MFIPYDDNNAMMVYEPTPEIEPEPEDHFMIPAMPKVKAYDTLAQRLATWTDEDTARFEYGLCFLEAQLNHLLGGVADETVSKVLAKNLDALRQMRNGAHGAIARSRADAKRLIA